VGLNALHGHSEATTITNKSYRLHELHKDFQLTNDLPRVIACQNETSYLEICFYYDKLQKVIADRKS
jgi:hypothetical protein